MLNNIKLEKPFSLFISIFNNRFFHLVVLTILASLLRIPQLGFSHFYGDEIKLLYLDKTVPAIEFFLNQRKGPIQFLVAWLMEKLTGCFDEFWIRLPFALAGILAVLVLYLLVYEIYRSEIVAFLAGLLFCFNGFYIAFSRTAQYQIWYILFGLLAFYLLLRFLRSENPKKFLFLLFASISMGVSFLSHYDAVFLIVPIIIYLVGSNLTSEKKFKYLIIFLTIVISVAGIFYIPYLLQGWFSGNVAGYLERRFTGENYAPNSSIYTASIYNPLYSGLLLLVFSVFSFYRGIDRRNLTLIIWFLVPFIVFEIFIRNPGTHIHNYYIPLIILSAYGINLVHSVLTNFWKISVNILVAGLVLFTFVVNLYVFIPSINTGYPYIAGKMLGFIQMPTADKQYHLFLYGFPYYRGWDLIGEEFQTYNRVQGFYTNDNTDIGQYYLKKFPVTPPGSNFLPQYYIHIPDNQEFRDKVLNVSENYDEITRVNFNNGLFATIYRLKYN